jgi:hypothetical protein
MPSRRRLLLLGGVILFLAVGVLIWCLTRPNPQIDRERFGQLKDGMTLAEVEAILGAPPGNYGGGDPNGYGLRACHGWVCSLFVDRHNSPTLTLDQIQKKLEEGRIVVWTGPHYAIAVHVDSQDRVVGTGLGVRFREPNTWERLLTRLGI